MASRIHLAAISDRKAFGFREQSPLPVASSGLPRAHLPFGQFLDLGFCIHAGGFSISPTLQGAWPENIRFDKTIVFPNSLSFAKFCRYPSALRPKIFVNRCHAYSDAEDQFFSTFRIDTVLVSTHFWIRIVLVS